MIRRGDTVGSELRAGLLQQVNAIARTIDPEQVKQLAFTEADKSNPVFQRLGEQMAGYEALARCRGIYTLVLRNGNLIFGPESYAEDDPQASPPGTVYEQPGERDRDIFRNGRAFTDGPSTDEYGTFVSALTPVLDPRSREVLMVVGLDLEAADWQAAIWREQLIAVRFSGRHVLR